MSQSLTGSAIGENAKSVWRAFPDVSLEISVSVTLEGGIAIQWMLHGTHTGPLMDGTPPSGRKVSYPGLPSLRLRAKRFALSKFTLTGRR
jgi:predicted ester cyclase